MEHTCPTPTGIFFLFSLTALEALNHNWIQEQTGGDNQSQEILHTSERSGTFKKFIGMQKLKKAALGYIATNLSPVEVGHLGDIFKKIDTDGDGRMTLQEIDRALMRGAFIFITYFISLP